MQVDEAESGTATRDSTSPVALKPTSSEDWTDVDVEVKEVIDVLTCASTSLDYTVVLTWVLQVTTIWTVAGEVAKLDGASDASFGTICSLLLSSFAIGSAIKTELFQLFRAYSIVNFAHEQQKSSFYVFILAQAVTSISVFIATAHIMSQQKNTMKVVINSAGVFVVMQVDDSLIQSVPLAGRSTQKLREALKETENKYSVNLHIGVLILISLSLFFVTLSLKPSQSSSSNDDDDDVY